MHYVQYLGVFIEHTPKVYLEKYNQQSNKHILGEEAGGRGKGAELLSVPVLHYTLTSNTNPSVV